MVRSIAFALTLMLAIAPALAQSAGSTQSTDLGNAGTDQQLSAPDAATTHKTGRAHNANSDYSRPGQQVTMGNKDIRITPSGQIETPNP